MFEKWVCACESKVQFHIVKMMVDTSHRLYFTSYLLFKTLTERTHVVLDSGPAYYY